MPRMVGRHHLGDHHGDGHQAADDEGHRQRPGPGSRNQSRHVDEGGHEERGADELAHAGEQHGRALVAVADPVDDPSRAAKVPPMAPTRMSDAGDAGGSLGAQRGVALVERRRPEPEPAERSAGDGRADHERPQSAHAHAPPARRRSRAPTPASRSGTTGRGGWERRFGLVAEGGSVALAPRWARAAARRPPPAATRARRPRGRPSASRTGGDHRRHHRARWPARRSGVDPQEGVGPPPHLGAVVVGDQRLRRRVVDRLADARGRPARQGTARSSGRCALRAEMSAPRRQHHGDDPGAPVAVGEVARRQRDEEAGEDEDAAEQAGSACR